MVFFCEVFTRFQLPAIERPAEETGELVCPRPESLRRPYITARADVRDPISRSPSCPDRNRWHVDPEPVVEYVLQGDVLRRAVDRRRVRARYLLGVGYACSRALS